MAQPKKNEKAIKAEELFKSGLKLTEIAAELDVPQGTVRRWKSTYKWAANTNTDNAERSAEQTKPKPNVRLEKKIAKMVTENPNLTERDKLFCLYYIQSYNATAAYAKAYESSRRVALSHGWRTMQKPAVKEEIQRLKLLKAEAILIDETDIVEKYMHIAFADLSDFVEWGTKEVPVMTKHGPQMQEDEETGELVPVMRTVNFVQFKESEEVDGTLIAEVRNGKDGASIKLADRMKAMEWLAAYFMINPMDKHRYEYETNRMMMTSGDQTSEENAQNSVVVYLPDNGRDNMKKVDNDSD